MSQQAEEEKLDPVVGRGKEIERVSQILSRRKKNNPLLLFYTCLFQNGTSCCSCIHPDFEFPEIPSPDFCTDMRVLRTKETEPIIYQIGRLRILLSESQTDNYQMILYVLAGVVLSGKKK